MAVKLTPSQARKKQATNLKAATIDMADRINAVTVAPGVLAAKKADKMRQNINKALDDGTWQKNVAAVPLEDWKKATIEKGIPRISSGIDAAAGKVEAFYGEFFPYLDNVAKKVDAMPDLTLQDSIARMTKQVTEVSKFRKSGK